MSQPGRARLLRGFLEGMGEWYGPARRSAGARKGHAGWRTGLKMHSSTASEGPPHPPDSTPCTCLRTLSTAPPHHAPPALLAALHTLRLADQTGESVGARTPCDCSPRPLRLAARKPNLTPTSPHICRTRESFQRHILLPVMPCCLASSLSRERNEAYTLLDLQRPASDWASCYHLPSSL